MTLLQRRHDLHRRGRSRPCCATACRCASRRTTAAASAWRTPTFSLHLVNERGLSLPADGAGRPRHGARLRRRRPGAGRRAPGRPVRRLVLLMDHLRFRKPTAAEALPPGARARSRQPAPPAPAAAGAPAALAAGCRGAAALHGPGRGGHPPPLRRLQRLLRDGARPVDGLHLRGLPDRGRRRLEEAQAEKYDLVCRKLGAAAGAAAARRRLRLGRHGPARGEALRRARRSA